MEAKNTTFSHRTPEEIRAWFKRRKAWYQEVEERAHAMYEKEQRMKREAIIVPRNHPQAEEALAHFYEETSMFNAMKP